jgi:coproporphyrinogen III oxidase
MSVLREDVFKKAAVNWPGVSGEQFPMQDGEGSFFAPGISLITHLHPPHAPTVHFNIRFIQTAQRTWFGGGYDLTPMGFPYEEETAHFHNIAKKPSTHSGSICIPLFLKTPRNTSTFPTEKKSEASAASFSITITRETGNKTLHSGNLLDAASC